MTKDGQKNYTDRLKEYSGRDGGEFLNFVLVVLFVVVICILVKTFFFENILIKQTSMYPTIENNATVTIFKTKNVKRGDIVIIDDKSVNENMLVKRVVGVGGDTVWISEDGVLHVSYINDDGERVTSAIYEKYVNRPNIVLEKTYVPYGYVFVLGDNRLISYDSSEFGSVKTEVVVGKVIMILN